MHYLVLLRGDTSPTQAESWGLVPGASVLGAADSSSQQWARLSACQHLPPVGKVFLLNSGFFQSERPRNLRQTETTKIPSKIPAKSLESNG